MKFYTVEQIGPKRHRTPEGFLLCEGVPLARTGEMIYGPGETLVKVGDDGRAYVSRDASEVFRAETVASANGKPVVDEHPAQNGYPENWVTPDNYAELARGSVLNPRQGEGAESDLLLGDLLITVQDAIEAVEAGKREVSCGYESDYEQTAPGRGRQRNIVINHVALVDRGRCGPRCAIGDQLKEADMARTTDKDEAGAGRKAAFFDRIRKAFADKDEKKLEDALKTGDDDPTNPLENHLHLHMGKEGEEEGKKGGDAAWRDRMEKTIDDLSKTVKRVADKVFKDEEEDDEEKKKKAKEEAEKTKDNEAILGNLEMEAPPGTGDKARRAADSGYLADAFQDTIALAEVLVPGIRIPTFDRAAEPRRTFDAMCGFRRQVLDLAYNQPETRPVMDDVLAGHPLDTKGMTCDAVRTMFRVVGAARKAKNNSARSRTAADTGVGGGTGIHGNVKTPADLNKLMAAKYGQ